MIPTLAMLMPALLLQSATAAPETSASQQSGDHQTAIATTETGSTHTTQLADATPTPITDKSHPDYVRCRSERVIGSLAKRTKTCKTNREWEDVARVGNRGARDIIESQQVGMNGQ